MKKIILVTLVLVGMKSFAQGIPEPTSNFGRTNARLAIQKVKQVLTSPVISGRMRNGSACTIRTGPGISNPKLFQITVSSAQKTLALVQMPSAGTVAVNVSGNSEVNRTTFAFSDQLSSYSVAVVQFDDISDFDLILTTNGTAVVCSFRE